MIRTTFAFALLVSFTLGSSGFAQAKGKRRGPPPEALAACEGLSENDVCSFESRRGSVEGVCRLSPQGKAPLACAPRRSAK